MGALSQPGAFWGFCWRSRCGTGELCPCGGQGSSWKPRQDVVSTGGLLACTDEVAGACPRAMSHALIAPGLPSGMAEPAAAGLGQRQTLANVAADEAVRSAILSQVRRVPGGTASWRATCG